MFATPGRSLEFFNARNKLQSSKTECQPLVRRAGGLGHLAIQYAKAMGLLVCAVDIDDGKLAHAKRLGADLVINAQVGDAAGALKKETGGGAHGVLITAPSLIAFKQGIGMTRKRGTCVLVGLPPGGIPGPALRCGGELHHHLRFVRRHTSGYGRSARLRCGGGRSRLISSCSRCRRLTESSTGSSMVRSRCAWSSTSFAG
jgi:threonine dehydrogenase-like Zn-dependent dehydrogenase